MAKQLPPIILRDLTGGVDNNTANALLPDEVFRHAINMDNDPKSTPFGTSMTREGFRNVQTITGTDPDVYGLFGHKYDYALVAYKLNSGDVNVEEFRPYSGGGTTATGTTPFDWGTTGKIRMEQYIGYTFACNGTYIRSWDGVAANDWGTTHLTSAPVGSLVKEYSGRLYVSGNSTYPSRVYYSGVPDSSNSLPDWDTTYDWFDVAPDDGDEVVALERNGGSLLVFKKRSLYVWDGTSLTRVPGTIGATSQEGVATVGNVTFFPFREATYDVRIYAYEQGSRPQYVSTAVRAWLSSENTFTNTGEDLAGWSDGDNYYFCAGSMDRDDIYADPELQFDNHYSDSTTVRDTSIVLKYCAATNSWQEWFLNCLPISFATNCDSSFVGNQSLLALNNSSNGDFDCVYGFAPETDRDYRSSFDVYTGSTTTPQDFYIQTKELEFGTKLRRKTINKFAVYAQGLLTDAMVYIRADGGEWESVGGLTDVVTTFSPGISGDYFELKIVGTLSDRTDADSSFGAARYGFVLEGIEFFDTTLDDYEY